MRRLFCVDCGELKFTYPEATTLGSTFRPVHDINVKSIVCDRCNKRFSPVPVSQPADMREWEFMDREQ